MYKTNFGKMFKVLNLCQIIEIYSKRTGFYYKPHIHTIIELFWTPVEIELRDILAKWKSSGTQLSTRFDPLLWYVDIISPPVTEM